MKVEEVTVKVSQAEILERIKAIKASDPLGEYVPALINYLDWEHAKPFLKEGVLPEQWKLLNDADLRNEILLYLEWWGQKVEDGRGISVHRGRAQMVNRLFLAGIPLWKEIGLDDGEGIDGGWYQEDAYNKVADLFGIPHRQGPREDE